MSDFTGLGKMDELERFSLIGINAVVERGVLKWSIEWSKLIRNQERMEAWVNACKETLEQLVLLLPSSQLQPTLSDYPLLPVDYTGLKDVIEKVFTLGVSSIDEIEDIYPCSPMQQGILVSQAKHLGDYRNKFIFKITPTTSAHVIDFQRIEAAWQLVVSRHAALRTVLFEGNSQSGVFSQLVRRQYTAAVSCHEVSPETDVFETIQSSSLSVKETSLSPHQLIIMSNGDGVVYGRFDISHALIDASSQIIIYRDLIYMYDNIHANHITQPLYSQVISHLKDQSVGPSLMYWKNVLANAEPCKFPPLNLYKTERKVKIVQVPFIDGLRLHNFCDNHQVTAANVLQAVWAIILRTYTGSRSVCFGVLSSGYVLSLFSV